MWPWRALVVQKLPLPDAEQLSLTMYEFSDFSLTDDDTLCATARMFVDMDLINRFHIPYDVRLLSGPRPHRRSLVEGALSAVDVRPSVRLSVACTDQLGYLVQCRRALCNHGLAVLNQKWMSTFQAKIASSLLLHIEMADITCKKGSREEWWATQNGIIIIIIIIIFILR